MNQPHQVLLVGEANVGRFQQTATLDEYAIRAVHQHVADFRIVHQRLQWTEAVNLVHDLADHQVAMLRRQRDRLHRAEVRRQRPQLRTQIILIELSSLRQVDGVDHPPMQMRLQPLKRLASIGRFVEGRFHDKSLPSHLVRQSQVRDVFVLFAAEF